VSRWCIDAACTADLVFGLAAAAACGCAPTSYAHEHRVQQGGAVRGWYVYTCVVCLGCVLGREELGNEPDQTRRSSKKVIRRQRRSEVITLFSTCKTTELTRGDQGFSAWRPDNQGALEVEGSKQKSRTERAGTLASAGLACQPASGREAACPHTRASGAWSYAEIQRPCELRSKQSASSLVLGRSCWFLEQQTDREERAGAQHPLGVALVCGPASR
jgi:hypothetical protein